MPRSHSGWRSRGYLPHYDASDTIQHIVFRLADALPVEVMRRLETASMQERFEAAEAALDAEFGARTLADPRAANIVQDALLHFDAARYHLLAWCVMPTHVHVLVAQINGWPLGGVVHTWKSFTAHAVNKALGLSGPLWAKEYFDRMMRNDEQIDSTRAYVENNPVSAGLSATPEAWPWSSASKGAPASRRHLGL